MQRELPDRPNVVAFPPLLLAATIGLGLALNFFLRIRFLPDRVTLPLGGLIIVCAITLALSAIREMRAANTPLDVRKASTELVTSGPFRLSRNPIYLGMLLLCTGGAVLANSLWMLFLTPLLALILQKGVIEREEAYLQQKFGETYLSYKAKVRRWI